MSKLSRNSSFWNWSLNVYANPGTKTACLRLQDEFTLDVNTLLWLCWLASIHKSPSSKALDRAASISRRWNLGLTRNVRKARKSLGKTALDSSKALKSDLLKLELLFEHRQQDELEQIAVMAKTGRISGSQLGQNNLDFYLASKETSSPQCARLTEALCKSIFKPN